MLAEVRPIIRKEFRQIRRDTRTLGILLFIPAFLLIMYGYALNFDVKRLTLAVVDFEKSQRSHDFYDGFLHSEYFDLKYALDRAQDIDRLMAENKVQVALVIPPTFSSNLLAGRETNVQVIVDGAESSIAGTAVGYVNAIAQSYSNGIILEKITRDGERLLRPPLDVEPRVWFNPELKSSRFLIPGLMAFILMITVTISTSFSVVREREKGSIEQIIVSPVRPAELILGKTIPYALISLASAHLVLLFGYLLFGVSVKGNYLLLLLGIILFIVGGLGFGLIISTIAYTQQVAFIISVMTTLMPTFILSGFVFPIRNMPLVIQGLTYLIPARYFLVILRAVMLKGAGLRAFWPQLVFLLAFAVLVLSLSSFRLRRILRSG
jgi:ABC-2 type transport system permease protein